MTQGSERQGGGGVEASLGPETTAVLKVALQTIPIIAGLVPTLTRTLQWGWDVSPSLTLPPQDRQAMALRWQSFTFS